MTYFAFMYINSMLALSKNVLKTRLSRQVATVQTCFCQFSFLQVGLHFEQFFCAEVFQDGRIVTAVTKYDLWFSDSPVRSRTRRRAQTSKSPRQLQQHIHDQVKSTIDVECPFDIIVPVSADWAEKARELMQDPSNEDLRHKVTESLCKVPEPLLLGQGETPSSAPPETLASQLEKSSGILQLEERYYIVTLLSLV